MIDLYNDDCLKVLPTLKEKSIDFVLTDIPYGTTYCKWDVVIPFDLMWEELKRIVKDNTATALFGTEPFSSHLRLSNLNWFKYDWIWEKSRASNFMNCKHHPMKFHENITVFSKKKHKYYPIKFKGKKNHASKPRKAISNIHAFKKNTNGIDINDMKYPKSIIKIKSTDSTRNLHPTQKPVPLLEYLIKTYTDENDTVLDFTMGSGSTGVACKNLNRNFIGIELDTDYFNIAKKRIDEVQT